MRLDYLKKVNENNIVTVSEKEIGALLETLRNTYSKMLENVKTDSGDVRIILFKYNKENEPLEVIYRLPQEVVTTPILFENFNRSKNNFANLYINSNSEISRVYSCEPKMDLKRWGSYLLYELKKQNKTIGLLSISSRQRVNERYGYENIKMLIEPIESVLVSYIQDYANVE